MRNLEVRQIYQASASMQTIGLAYSNQYFKLFIVYFRVSSPALLPLAFVATSILAGLFCSSSRLYGGEKKQLQLNKATVFLSLTDGWMHKYGFYNRIEWSNNSQVSRPINRTDYFDDSFKESPGLCSGTETMRCWMLLKDTCWTSGCMICTCGGNKQNRLLIRWQHVTRVSGMLAVLQKRGRSTDSLPGEAR